MSLKHRVRKYDSRTRGFSLIELMVAMGILSVLMLMMTALLTAEGFQQDEIDISENPCPEIGPLGEEHKIPIGASHRFLKNILDQRLIPETTAAERFQYSLKRLQV